MADKPVYSYEPHSFSNSPVLGKPYCNKCGLLALNNAFTRWSIKMGCLSELHPQYQTQRRNARERHS